MKTVVLVTAGALALAGVASVSGGSSQSANGSNDPWQVGRCYRVFPGDRDQLYIFKVLDAPTGQWIRVQSDPAAQRVPGARPQVPLWLNAHSPFAVQEWPCSE